MNGLDIWATAAYAIASVALGLRANMLKPHYGRWAQAPAAVWASIFVLSVAAGIGVLSLVWPRGASSHATAREAMVATALAVAAVVLLINLHRQRMAPKAPIPGHPDA